MEEEEEEIFPVSGALISARPSSERVVASSDKVIEFERTEGGRAGLGSMMPLRRLSQCFHKPMLDVDERNLSMLQ